MATLFQKTQSAVQDLKAVLPNLPSNPSQSLVSDESVEENLATLVKLGETLKSTTESISKMRTKAMETDPNKITYGPNMKAKVVGLLEEYDGVANDLNKIQELLVAYMDESEKRKAARATAEEKAAEMEAQAKAEEQARVKAEQEAIVEQQKVQEAEAQRKKSAEAAAERAKVAAEQARIRAEKEAEERRKIAEELAKQEEAARIAQSLADIKVTRKEYSDSELIAIAEKECNEVSKRR